MSPGTSIEIAAALTVLVGAGFGLPIPWAAWRLRQTGHLPTFIGLFPMYGGPLFPRVSHRTFTLVLLSFAAVCALDVLAGLALWRDDRDAAILVLALLPVEAAYWVAFALPIPPVIAVVRVALLAFGWRALA